MIPAVIMWAFGATACQAGLCVKFDTSVRITIQSATYEQATEVGADQEVGFCVRAVVGHVVRGASGAPVRRVQNVGASAAAGNDGGARVRGQGGPGRQAGRHASGEA